MEKSNLIELIKTLTIKEIKIFLLFLDSPYFSKGRYKKEAKNLFILIQKYAPQYENAKLSKENVYAQIFPTEPFTDGRIEKVMTELYKSIRLFLITEYNLRPENEYSNQVDFATILHKKGLNHKATALTSTILDELNSKMDKTDKSYADQFNASDLKHVLETENNQWKDDLSIGMSLRYLDLYYYANRLRLLNHYLLISLHSKVVINIDIEKEKSMFHLFKIEADEAPSVFVAQKVFELYTSPNPSYADFENLFQLIVQYEQSIDASSIKHYFSYLRNYCSLLINKGHTELWAILHKIHLDNLQKGYFFYEDRIPPGSYGNIINAALEIGEYVWAKEFMDTYKDHIVGDNQTKDQYHFNLAKYFFARGQFEDALACLPPIFQNLDIQLFARRLELKSYYEIGSDLLFYKLDAFKMYINRASKKILSDDTRERNTNFVNILFQITQSKPGDPNRKEIILKRIHEKSILTDKKWLIEKVNKLK